MAEHNKFEDFEKILKQGLRQQRSQFSEDQRNFHKNQMADNAQVVGLVRAIQADIRQKIAKHPILKEHFDQGLLNSDPASMDATSLQALLTNLIKADVEVKEAAGEQGGGLMDSFIKACKSYLSGKKDCHNHDNTKAAGQILKPLFTGVVPPGFVITPNTKKKLEKSVEI
jgi:hypothetical protein